MSRRVHVRDLAAVAVALALAACSGTAPTTSGTGSGKSVAMLNPFANPFQTDIARGGKALAEKNGVTFSSLNFAANSQTEAQYVSDVISKKVNVVIYGANDPNIALANIKKIREAGIHVVCFDSCIEPNLIPQYVKGFVTSDNTALGRVTGEQAAEYIKTKLNGKAKIAFVTCDSQTVCRERHDAQVKALEAVQTTVVDNQVAIESDKVKAVTEGILQAHPDLDMIITDGLPQTEGATAAIRNLGKKVVVFGMDITPAIAQDLLATDNILQVAVGQDGIKMGEISTQMALDVLNGKDPSPASVLIEGKVYSRANQADVQAYLNSAK
jgi:sugar transport system substrate-binding protein